MVNVWGDSIATGCVAHMSRREVADYEREQRLKNQQESLTNSDEVLVDNLVHDPLKHNGFTHPFLP